MLAQTKASRLFGLVQALEGLPKELMTMLSNMNTPRIRAYLSRRLPPAVEDRIAERYDVVRNPQDAILTPEELAREATGCSYIFTSAMQPVTREVFQELRGTVKAIGTLSVGYNHIDIPAAKEFGVAVFYSPGVLSDACAELAIMLLLNATRRGYEADTVVRTDAWTGYAPTQLLGVGLTGRRAGILGMGRIGQAVSKRLKAFGVTVHYHNRNRLTPNGEDGVIYHPTPDSLLAVSDFLLLLTPAAPDCSDSLIMTESIFFPRALLSLTYRAAKSSTTTRSSERFIRAASLQPVSMSLLMNRQSTRAIAP